MTPRQRWKINWEAFCRNSLMVIVNGSRREAVSWVEMTLTKTIVPLLFWSRCKNLNSIISGKFCNVRAMFCNYLAATVQSMISIWSFFVTCSFLLNEILNLLLSKNRTNSLCSNSPIPWVPAIGYIDFSWRRNKSCFLLENIQNFRG